jgi:hypothetical protein
MGGLFRGITDAVGLTSPAPEVRQPSPAEQAQASKEVAMWNAGLNRISQATPFSTTDYVYTGTDANGVPQYKQVTKFTEAGQQQYQNLMTAQASSNQLLPGLVNQSQQLLNRDYSNNLVTDYGSATTSQAAYEQYLNRGTEEINKYYDKQRQQIEQRLFNQGVSANSDAYRTALQDFEKSRGQSISDLAFSALQSADTRAMQAAAFKNQALAQQQSMQQSGLSVAQSLYTTLYGAGSASMNMAAPAYAQIQGVDYNAIMNRDAGVQQYNANMQWQSDKQFNDLMMKAATGMASSGTGQTMAGIKWGQ